MKMLIFKRHIRASAGLNCKYYYNGEMTLFGKILCCILFLTVISINF